MSDYQKQTIQWFPGHMAKTRRLIKESLPLVDAVAEIVDARIPLSSRNPELDSIVSGKPRIVLLNKCDVADPNSTKRWIEFFSNRGVAALAVDCRSGKGVNMFAPTVKKALEAKIQSNIEKGMAGKALRIMIVGIPNSGKSSFINRMAGKSRAKVADKPGVTRQNQWFVIGNGIELLDTPGVLWPKFEDPLVGDKLAFTGAIKDEVMDIEALAIKLLDILKKVKPQCIIDRYKISDFEEKEGYEILEMIGRKRGFLISGGEIDTERAAIIIIDEFRGGKIGNITLELPERE